MVLIIKAPGTITNPSFIYPDATSGVFLEWDAETLSALEDDDEVTEWGATRHADVFTAAQAKLATPSISGITKPVKETYDGVPAVKFSGTSTFAAGHRSNTAAPSGQQHLAGEAITISLLARQVTIPAGAANAFARLFSGRDGAGLAARQGSNGAYRYIVAPAGNMADIISPYIEMPGDYGDWFAASFCWDYARKKITACVNGGTEIVWSVSSDFPTYFSTFTLGRAITTLTTESLTTSYSQAKVFARALKPEDMREQHEIWRRRFDLHW